MNSANRASGGAVRGWMSPVPGDPAAGRWRQGNAASRLQDQPDCAQVDHDGEEILHDRG
jgi:hypothetical protein